MLTVQPTLFTQHTSFKSNFENDENTYRQRRNDLQKQIMELEQLKEDETFSKPVNKIIKGGVVIASGGLGFLAGTFAMNKVGHLAVQMIKSKSLQTLIKAAKSFGTFTKNSAKSIKNHFIESDLYQKPTVALQAQKAKFLNTKFGNKLSKFYNNVKENKYVTFITEGIKNIIKSVKSGIKYVYNKLKGIKKESYKEGIVNVFGTASGIASGVAAARKDSPSEEVCEAA